VAFVFDQPHQGGHRFFVLLAFGQQMYIGAFAGSQHHDCHDALAVHQAFGAATNAYLAGVGARHADELRRGAGVQTELVDDGDFTCGHRGMAP
jgi:hypothetical protein